MDWIFIEGLRVRAIIGVLDRERTLEQELRITARVAVTPRPPDAPDDLTGRVDYAALAEKLAAHARAAQRFTLEALAEDLAQICLREPGALQVRIRLEKPEAVEDAEAVGVEIERERGIASSRLRRSSQ